MKLTNRFLSYLIVLLQSSIYGMSPDGVKPNQAQLRDAPMPTQSVMNINNMAYWITKSTGGTTSGSQNGTQADYPIGTGGLIYEDGMLWGVKVTDGNSQSPRVGGTTYYDGLKAGRVIYNDDGNVIGSTDPANHHVWRVRRDYLTADLYSDAASFYGTTEPSENEIQNVFDQYEYDWNNWPADWGAPFEDVDGNGTYNPAVDIPGYQGASQTLWVVANDVPIIVDDSGNVTGEINTAPTVYGADPIGIELQVTLWAYNYGATAPLGNVLFKHVQMQYTGLTEGYNNFNSAIAHLDTVYFTQWSDPDLGTYTDDYVGYDLNHSLGYVYNSTNQDDMFNDYGVSVPSGGYDFLQGPEVEGEFLPVTAFSYFGAGSEIYDPDLSSYAGTLQFFNLMEGFLPRPYYPNQEPWIDITTGEITKFVLTGDPLTGEGWVDGIQLPPGDRRMVMTSGPFAMEIGEIQEIVLALIGGHGSDNLTSISVLKYHDQFAQYAYDTNYDLPEAPITPIVSVSPLDTAIILNWNENAELVESHSSVGFEFQGYNVYQLPVEYSSIDDGERITTFDIIDYVQTIFDLALDEETGYIYRIPVQFGTNSGLQRYYTVDWDHINNQPLQPGQEYYFAVTAYSFNDDSNEQMPFCTLESSFTLIAESLQIVPEYDYGDEIVSIGHSGTAGGTGVTIDIISPDQLTGHDYEVFFDLQHYYRDLGGFWQMTNYPDSVGRVLGKTLDCSG
ncbi:MAG: hypothetical protein H8E64_08830, partial [Candidatus Marinimicrobia bacterium]|nr:hypothetical protein [Candidatus Neomarinimicrobiota bacterium]